MAVAISHKGNSTTGADKGINGFAPDLLRMSVPPLLPTSGGTEFDFLPSGFLLNRFTAFFTELGLDRSSNATGGADTGQIIPLAVGFDGTDGDAQRLCDCGIAAFFPAQFPDSVFPSFCDDLGSFR